MLTTQSCIKYIMSLGFIVFAYQATYSQQLADNLKKDTYSEVDQMPQFPGCTEKDQTAQKQCAQKKFLAFISENLKYPKEVEEKNLEGVVVVNFTVTAKGKIKGISTKKSMNKSCDAASVRVVQLMNEKGIVWIPGKKDGKPVDVELNLPIRFKLK